MSYINLYIEIFVAWVTMSDFFLVQCMLKKFESQNQFLRWSKGLQKPLHFLNKKSMFLNLLNRDPDFTTCLSYLSSTIRLLATPEYSLSTELILFWFSLPRKDDRLVLIWNTFSFDHWGAAFGRGERCSHYKIKKPTGSFCSNKAKAKCSTF